VSQIRDVTSHFCVKSCKDNTYKSFIAGLEFQIPSARQMDFCWRSCVFHALHFTFYINLWVSIFVCVCVNFFFRKEKTTLSLVSSRSLLASLREQIRERKALGMKAPYPELCAVNDNGYVHETGVLHTNMCAKEPYKGCHQERAGFNTSWGVYIEGGVLKTWWLRL